MSVVRVRAATPNPQSLTPNPSDERQTHVARVSITEFAPRVLRRSLLDKPTTKNDLNAAVPKFCLAVEEHRRTPEGRVRTSQEFLNHFFPYDDAKAKDQLF